MPAPPPDLDLPPARAAGTGHRGASDAGAVGARRHPDGDLGTVLLAAALAAAAAWAVARSGAAGTGWGRAVGRLDGALPVLLVVLVAGAWARALGRVLDGAPAPRPRDVGRTVLRRVLVPWWVVVTAATYLYPTAPGAVVPSDDAAPTWGEVVREWLLLSPLGRPPAGTPWPPAAAGRLPWGWVVAAAVVLLVAVAAGERLLARARAAGGDPVALALAAGAVLVAGGLALQVAVASRDAVGLWVALRASPVAQADLLGAGIVAGSVVATARRGTGPLAAGLDLVRSGIPRLAGVLAAALLAGAAGPSVGSLVDPGGVASTAVARSGLVLLGGAAALWAMAPAPAARSAAGARARRLLARRGRDAWLGALLVAPLAAQLWATRAGGPPGTQRAGPLVLVTVAGALAVGLALGAAGRRLFGADGRRPWTRFSTSLAVITGVALAWRLLTLVSLNRRNPGGGDPFFYHQQANMLADRVGFSEPFRWAESGLAVPTALHPPLLSTWLALGSTLGARTYLAHKALTALLGVGSVVVAALIARRLAGDRAALVTALLVAAYPNLWVIDGALWPEGAYTTLVGLAVLATYRWWERPTVGRAAALGAAVAVAALTRGEALFLYPLLVAPVVLRRRGIGLAAAVRCGAVAGLAGLLVVSPWVVRTYRAFDELIPLSSNGDELLYYSNCPDSYGLVDDRPAPEGAPAPSDQFLGYWSFNCQQRERARGGMPVAGEEEAALYRRCLGPFADTFDGTVPGEPPGDEVDRARYWRCLALDYAGDHVDRLPAVVAARVGRVLDLYRPAQGRLFLEVEGRPAGVVRAGQLAWYALAPVGLAGWVVLRRRRVLVYPFVALGLMVLVTTVYAYGAVRFRTPLELGLLVGAGVALDAAWERLRARAPDAGREAR